MKRKRVEQIEVEYRSPEAVVSAVREWRWPWKSLELSTVQKCAQNNKVVAPQSDNMSDKIDTKRVEERKWITKNGKQCRGKSQ